MTFNELIRKLEKAGCVRVSTGRGSRRKYKAPNGEIFVIHDHGSQEVKKGMERQVLKDAGLV